MGNGSMPARVRLYCPETDRYLQSDGTWSTPGTVTDLWTRTTASFALAVATPLAFTLPTYAETGLAHVTLHKIAIASEASLTGTVYVDEFHVRLCPDTLAFHGHNISPRVSVVWQGSATGAWAGEEVVLATMTVAEHRFYSHLTSPSELPFHRIRSVGTNYDARKGGPMIWIGELGLFQALALANAVRIEWDEEPTLAPGATVPQMRITPAWIWRTDLAHQEFMREVLARAEYGRESESHPLWLIPSSIEAPCYFCRPTAARVRRLFRGIHQSQPIAFGEEPFPLWL
jgi:hypothetical protein